MRTLSGEETVILASFVLLLWPILHERGLPLTPDLDEAAALRALGCPFGPDSPEARTLRQLAENRVLRAALIARGEMQPE